MSWITGLTLNQARALCSLFDAVDGCPKQPSHVGAVAATMGLTGVTSAHAKPRKHPTRDEYAVPVRIMRPILAAYQGNTLPPIARARIDALTTAQRIAIRDAIRDAVDLTDDWKPASVIGP
jgi:hypothetical protein